MPEANAPKEECLRVAARPRSGRPYGAGGPGQASSCKRADAALTPWAPDAGAKGWKRGLTTMSALRADSAGIGLPPAQGLYDPALEKDSCGVGFIADIKSRKTASNEELRKLQDDVVTFNETPWVSKGDPVPGIGANAR